MYDKVISENHLNICKTQKTLSLQKDGSPDIKFYKTPNKQHQTLNYL